MAALVKPVRARKPRPASLPPLTKHVDDAAGEMFLQSLALVRKRVKEMRNVSTTLIQPGLEFRLGWSGRLCGIELSEAAGFLV
jgi:hypothetical protein